MNELRGYARVTIDDKEYGLRFNSHCFKMFGELNHVELTELGTIQGMEGTRDLIWCAGKTYAELTGGEWPFTMLQIEDWIDYIEDEEMAVVVRAINSTKIFGQQLKAGIGDEDEGEETKN